MWHTPFNWKRGLWSWTVFWSMTSGLFLFLMGCASVPSDPVLSLSDGRAGRVWFATRTMRFPTFLKGGHSAPEAMIFGSLRLPKGNGKGPAVVLVHGSGGVSWNHHRWASELRKEGYVTFLLDSFTGRSRMGIATRGRWPRRLSSAAMIYDAYRALDLLATHPRVDPNRVALMGFSKGGIVALYAALDRFHTLNGTSGLRYAAHLPFYPACSLEFRDLGTASSVPIRIFHGGADDWTPAEPCRNLVTAWRDHGADIEMTVYPGAHHSFDVSTRPETRYLPNIQNLECTFVETADRLLVNRDTGEPLKRTDACIRRGATVGYDPEAAHQARIAVHAALSTFLGLP